MGTSMSQRDGCYLALEARRTRYGPFAARLIDLAVIVTLAFHWREYRKLPGSRWYRCEQRGLYGDRESTLCCERGRNIKKAAV